MRDLTSITNMLPDLQNKLAFMYYELVRLSKHQIVVDRSAYNKAESDLTAIQLLIACDTDLEQINAFLNDFLKYIHTCCLPPICDPDVVELECQADSTLPTFWVPDGIACEVTTTTTTSTTTTTTQTPPTLYDIYATTTSFDDPDLVGEFLADANNIEVILKAETGTDKQFILIEDEFPHSLVGIYYFSYALGMYINVNKISEFTHSTITNFDKWLYNGVKRGTTKVKLVFA